MHIVNHFPIHSIFFFSHSCYLKSFQPTFGKTRLNQAFPEMCYTEHLKRSVTANICKAPGENFCSRIELDDASVESFNCWASQLLRTHKSFVFICLVWVFYSMEWKWFQVQAIKRGHRGEIHSSSAKGGLDLLHLSAFDEERFILHTYSFLCMKIGEFWKRTGHE